MDKLNPTVKKGRAVRGETGSLAKPMNAMNAMNTLRKADPATLAAVAANAAPEDGRLQKALKFVADTEPYFSLSKVGGSRLLPGKWLALARAALAVAILGVGIASLKRGSMTGLFVSVPYALLYIALAWMSFMSTMRSGKMAMMKESFIVGAIYQTLASVGLWMAPISIIAIVRNMGRVAGQRNHLMQYVACILPGGMFLLDCTFLGAAPYFRRLLVIAPLLVEAIIVAANFAFGGIQRPPKPMRGMFNLVLLVAAIWALASAFLAVAVSRVARCCGSPVVQERVEVNEVTPPANVHVDVENGEGGRDRMVSAP